MSEAAKSDPVLGALVRDHLIEHGVETPSSMLAPTSERIATATAHFDNVLGLLGMDLTDDSMQDTPRRVAKMYVNELFRGLDYTNFPKCTVIDNKMQHDEMVLERNVKIMSVCFVAGTMVETPHGRVPIERIKKGEWVYSMNMETHELELKRATTDGVMIQESSDLVEVYTDNATVKCTPDHKFYTNNRGWVEAKDLVSGDSITSLYRRAYGSAEGNRVALSNKDKSTSAKNKNKLTIPQGMSDRAEAHIVYCLHNGLSKEDIRYKVVHHIDENPHNNDPENLQLLTISDHNRAHKRTEKFADSEYRKKRAIKGVTQESLEQRSMAVASHWANMTEEEYDARCAAMSAGILSSARNHRVISVTALDYKEPTYCFEVEDNHNFFVEGMLVHNCEHHLAPIHGVAHIAYIPRNKIVGLSKLNRVADFFARRPQVQERLTEQVYHALSYILDTPDVAVVIDAEHFCVKMRGVEDANSHTITSKLGGVFRKDATARQEFLSLIRVRQ